MIWSVDFIAHVICLAFSTKETFRDGYVISLHKSLFWNLRVLIFGRWVRTGDEVIVREDGEVFIVDRVKVCYFPQNHPR